MTVLEIIALAQTLGVFGIWYRLGTINKTLEVHDERLDKLEDFKSKKEKLKWT
jgi:hypothetical protein